MVAAALAPAAAAAAPTIGPCPAFPANNVWNTRVDNLPVHPRSAAWVANVRFGGDGATRRFHMDFDSAVYPPFPDPDAAPIGIPYVQVPGSQPKVPVTFTDYGDESDASPGVPAPLVGGLYKGDYPIPPNAPIEGVGNNPNSGGDRHVLVVDTTNCILYETGNSYPINNGATWNASGGATWSLNSNNLRTAGYTSADAAGLPIFPLLARYEEVNAGAIEHALRFTADRTQKAYLWPATHFASSITDPNVAPMGARFRLKASKDISAFPPQAKIIAQAMKTYGIILADNGSSWFVSGAPNLGWDTNQMAALNGGLLTGGDFEAVDVSSLMVSPTSAQVKPRASTTALASSLNPSASGSVILTATVTATGGTPNPTGTVAFKDGNTTLCNAVALGGGGTATCNASGLTAGSHPIIATYSGDIVFAGSASVALSQVITSGAALLTATPTTLAFGGQSMNTTSPSQSTTITNNSGSAVTVGTIVAPQGFAVSHNCPASLANAGSCVATLTFTPNAAGSFNNPLAINQTGGGPTTVALTGTGEKSLVTHYYRSILRRAPDASGKTFWDGESTRVGNLGANVNEVWYSMAQTFYFSTEYAAFNRSNSAFVTDLYNTFFNRAPDSGGLNFWVNNLGGGMPREVALAEFMFSTEFRNFSQAIFGNAAVRAELDMVMDFYRGLLSRLPDDAGFNFWVGQFRTAQCQGQAAILTQVESISSAFALSAEYTGRNRSNAQYVGDLYNAFLRRGGDQAGVQFWIGQLNTSAQTREQLRVAFKNSPEFQARVNAVVAQGCL